MSSYDIKAIIDNYLPMEFGITDADLGSEPFTYERLVHLMNTAHMEICNESAVSGCYLLDTEFAINGVDNESQDFEQEEDLPDNLVALVGVYAYDTSSGSPLWTALVQLPAETVLGAGSLFWNNYRLGNGKIYFIRPTYEDYKVKYYRQPGLLHYADVASATGTTLTASPSTAVGLISRGSQSYVGDRIKIYSGTGAGQVRTISAYNPSTVQFTVSSAWSANPDNTSKYSILPVVPDNFMHMLVWGIGKNMHNLDPSLRGKMEANWSNAFTQFRQAYTPRDEVTPQRVAIIQQQPAIRGMGRYALGLPGGYIGG